jgi:hypothetical protein
MTIKAHYLLTNSLLEPGRWAGGILLGNMRRIMKCIISEVAFLGQRLGKLAYCDYIVNGPCSSPLILHIASVSA